MGKTLQNIIYGYDKTTKSFMDTGLCAALTCKWLELCQEGEFMPFRKEVGKEGIRIAYGPYDDEEADDIAMFWWLLRRTQSLYNGKGITRKALIESHKLWVVGDIITGKTGNQEKMINDILYSGDGYSYLGLTGSKSGHAMGLGIFPGMMRFYNPEYGEEVYTSKADFSEMLRELFDEEYPPELYADYEIYRVVGK